MKVLFVCRANCGRSQMAEAIFNKLAAGRHVATSAGTLVRGGYEVTTHGDKLEDEPTSRAGVIPTMAEIGIDVSHNLRTQLTPELVSAADLVVLITDEFVPSYLVECKNLVTWEIPDPKGRGREFSRATREEITIRVKNLIDGISE